MIVCVIVCAIVARDRITTNSELALRNGMDGSNAFLTYLFLFDNSGGLLVEWCAESRRKMVLCNPLSLRGISWSV